MTPEAEAALKREYEAFKASYAAAIGAVDEQYAARLGALAAKAKAAGGMYTDVSLTFILPESKRSAAAKRVYSFR